MPCYKRHKQWAQCSGKRDPTVFVKKSKLYTPAGVDHDYNFITGIERGVDEADRKLEDRGIHTDSYVKGPRHEGCLRHAIEAAQVTIERAPKGMSRQKQNKTHWLPRLKCVEWSVEWLHADYSSHLDLVKDDMPLWQAHFFLTRRLSREPKKRKRETDEPNPNTTFDGKLESGTSSSHNQTKHTTNEAFTTENASFKDHNSARPENSSLTGASAAENGVEEGTDVRHDRPSPLQSNSVKLDEVPKMKVGDADPAGNYYYLVKARARSNCKVLVPLSPDGVLSKCLKQQTILEFPTIQVLSCPPAEIPADYLLERDYLARFPSAQSDSESESESGDEDDDDDDEDDDDKGRGDDDKEFISNVSAEEDAKVEMESVPPRRRISNANDIYSILQQSIM